MEANAEASRGRDGDRGAGARGRDRRPRGRSGSPAGDANADSRESVRGRPLPAALARVTAVPTADPVARVCQTADAVPVQKNPTGHSVSKLAVPAESDPNPKNPQLDSTAEVTPGKNAWEGLREAGDFIASTLVEETSYMTGYNPYASYGQNMDYGSWNPHQGAGYDYTGAWVPPVQRAVEQPWNSGAVEEQQESRKAGAMDIEARISANLEKAKQRAAEKQAEDAPKRPAMRGEIQNPDADRTCWDFTRGNCSRGSACTWMHGEETEAQTKERSRGAGRSNKGKGKGQKEKGDGKGNRRPKDTSAADACSGINLDILEGWAGCADPMATHGSYPLGGPPSRPPPGFT